MIQEWPVFVDYDAHRIIKSTVNIIENLSSNLLNRILMIHWPCRISREAFLDIVPRKVTFYDN